MNSGAPTGANRRRRLSLFRPFYEKAIEWAAKPRADVWLSLLSFVEAFIFPVAPEIMLAPMTLARPRRWWQFASLSLFFSLLGSLVGYVLGHYVYELVQPLLSAHMQATIAQWVGQLRVDMRQHWLMLLVTLLVAAIQPLIPMKLVTWAAGIVGVPILPFLACILVGRGKRVFLVAGVIRLGGERAEKALHKHIETAGWVIVAIVVALALYFWLR